MTKKTFKELYSSVSNEKDLEEFRLISRQQISHTFEEKRERKS